LRPLTPISDMLFARQFFSQLTRELMYVGGLTK
jgi:hypothetical protein